MTSEAQISIGTRVRCTHEGLVTGVMGLDNRDRHLLEVTSDAGHIAWLPECKLDILAPPQPAEPVLGENVTVWDADGDHWTRGGDGRWRTIHSDAGHQWAEVCKFAPLHTRRTLV